jgi:hypothetical protein
LTRVDRCHVHSGTREAYQSPSIFANKPSRDVVHVTAQTHRPEHVAGGAACSRLGDGAAPAPPAPHPLVNPHIARGSPCFNRTSSPAPAKSSSSNPMSWCRPGPSQALPNRPAGPPPHPPPYGARNRTKAPRIGRPDDFFPISGRTPPRPISSRRARLCAPSSLVGARDGGQLESAHAILPSRPPPRDSPSRHPPGRPPRGLAVSFLALRQSGWCGTARSRLLARGTITSPEYVGGSTQQWWWWAHLPWL